MLGGQVSERDTVILGAHAWGLPGAYGGVKCGGEWTRRARRRRRAALAVDRHARGDAAAPDGRGPRRAVERHPLGDAQPERARGRRRRLYRKGRLDQDGAPAPSSIAMSILAQGQLGAGKRVKGRLSTRGVVGLALELSGASSLALQCELYMTGAKAPPVWRHCSSVRERARGRE